MCHNEQFKPIENYENYLISSYGRVYSKWGNGRFLKGSTKGKYNQVGLCRNNKTKTFMVHALVGNAFIGKRENGNTYDHIDRNTKNNNVNNIRLATRGEQIINQKTRCDNKLKEKNISQYSYKGYKTYRVKINRNGKQVLNRHLHTMEDAIRVRDNFLKDL